MELKPQVVSKMSLSSEENLKLFHALDHPLRLEILAFIFGINPRVSYSAIKTKFNLSDGNLSHHLKVLLDAKLIKNIWIRPEDRNSDYSYYSATERAKEIAQQYAAS